MTTVHYTDHVESTLRTVEYIIESGELDTSQ